ncbi:MAG: hypothetical protein GWN33_16315 [Gammaproteobacteria bacterium]|nr:hypothetical protein [Gammaproteobacteria bacterium]
MHRSLLLRQRMIGLFLLGVLLLYSPLLSVFDTNAELLGLPVIYIYLFSTWVALIALIAWLVERGRT